MIGLIIAVSSLVAFPFIFPGETIKLLTQAKLWLRKRQDEHAQQQAALYRLWLASHDAQTLLTLLADDQLYLTPSTEKRYLILAQILAAGQRLLKTVHRSQFPDAYQMTARLCQKTEHLLDLLHRLNAQQKKGQFNDMPRSKV
jgi:hypothetical protein